jgi:hypothetical protein
LVRRSAVVKQDCPEDLRSGIRILKTLRDEVSQDGVMNGERWKDLITKSFGIDLYEALSEWKTTDLLAMQAAEFFKTHTKNFGSDSASVLVPPEGPKIVLDPKTGS